MSELEEYKSDAIIEREIVDFYTPELKVVWDPHNDPTMVSIFDEGIPRITITEGGARNLAEILLDMLPLDDKPVQAALKFLKEDTYLSQAAVDAQEYVRPSDDAYPPTWI